MKKTAKSMLLLLPLVAGMLVGCQNTDTPSGGSSGGDTPTSSDSPASGTTTSETPSPTTSYASDIAENVTLTMAVGYQPSKYLTNMKFIAGYGPLASANTWTGVDGHVYRAGDFKPVWRQLQLNLNFTIDDQTGNAADGVSKLYEQYQNTNFHVGTADGELVNIIVGNGDDIVADGTTGKILDLANYLDQMPNFNNFLTENPAVKQIIMADPTNNKGIYYAPYFDGYDDLEKALIVRKDWVEALLDGETLPDLDEAKTVTTAYTTYIGDNVDDTVQIVNGDAVASVTKKHSESIITKQNALEKKDGKSLVSALRTYIDDTYNKYYGTKRSELFVGSKAAYDIDELVALYRCVYANPEFLTGDASKVIVPLTPRESGANRVADMWRFMQFFGARGLESRNGWFYVDKDGKLNDCRDDDAVMNALTKMNEMYQEGLILQKFTDNSATAQGKGKHNDYLQKHDQAFSIYDYVQTQTTFNDNPDCAAFNGGKYELVPVMPAAYDWDGDGNQDHYTESWRSVKPNGWCITAETANSEADLKRSLKVFDYLYSEEGHNLMSFGPDAWMDGTVEYLGEKIPALSAGAKDQLANQAGGNYTNYFRQYVGGTFPIGYVKEQGMEWQATSSKAAAGLTEINKCITLGTLKHQNHKTDNTDVMQDIVPATFAYDATQASTVDSYTGMSVVFNVESSRSNVNVWSYIVMEGWSGDSVKKISDGNNTIDMTKDNYKTAVNEKLYVESLVRIANAAYAKMGMRTASSSTTTSSAAA